MHVSVSSGKVEYFAIFFIVSILTIGKLTDKLTQQLQPNIMVRKMGHPSRQDYDSVQRSQIIFNKGYIENKPHFYFDQNKFMFNALIPGRYILDDLVTGLAIIIICIIFLLRYKYFDFQKPFSSQFVKGVKKAGIVLIIFGIIDFYRIRYLDNYINNDTKVYITEGVSLVSRPLIWLGILVLWMQRIIRKGEEIQKEQELTV